MGKLALFQLCSQLSQVILIKLARVFFKNGLRGLGRRGVKQADRGHILSERLRDAGDQLGQHQHADACVASRKAELD